MINEQNNFRTVEEAEDAGFSLDRPSDYTSEKYDLIEVEGFRMYRLKSVETTPEEPSDPVDNTPPTETPDSESDSGTDPDTTPRDQERTEYNPSNRCVEELSTSYFCLRCKEGSSIEECNQTGESLYDGECNLYDRQKIAREISQKLACVGMRPLKKGSFKSYKWKIVFFR